MASRYNYDELLTTWRVVAQIIEMTAANIGLSAKHSLRCLNTAQSIGRSALRCASHHGWSGFDWRLVDVVSVDFDFDFDADVDFDTYFVTLFRRRNRLLCNQIVTLSEQTRGVILKQVWYIKTVRIVINSWSN